MNSGTAEHNRGDDRVRRMESVGSPRQSTPKNTIHPPNSLTNTFSSEFVSSPNCGQSSPQVQASGHESVSLAEQSLCQSSGTSQVRLTAHEFSFIFSIEKHASRASSAASRRQARFFGVTALKSPVVHSTLSHGGDPYFAGPSGNAGRHPTGKPLRGPM